jgi:hypothetical protein
MPDARDSTIISVNLRLSAGLGFTRLMSRVFSLLVLVFIFRLPATALDREAFTFIHYSLQLHIDPQLQTLSATGAVELRNDSAEPQKNVVLQISSSLRWTLITQDGKPVQYVAHDYASDVDHTGSLSEAVVTLPHAVPPGGAVHLQISYDGVITRDTTRLERLGTPQEIAARTDWDQIGKDFTAVRGVGYVCWYPVAMEAVRLSDASDYSQIMSRWKARESRAIMQAAIFDFPHVDMNVKPDSARGGGGSASGHGHASSNRVSFSFDPVGDLVPMFFAANYRDRSQDRLAVHYLASHEAAAKNYVTVAGAVEALIQTWFGGPEHHTYQAEIYDLPDDHAAPYETGNMLFTPIRDMNTTELQLELAHELTHAYISSPRPWINEGLAHFAQALEREQQAGRHAAIEFMQRFLPPLADAEKSRTASPAAPGGPPSPPLNSTDSSLAATSDDVFYRTKAMYVWWMLRDMLGDKVIRQALLRYSPADDTEPSYMQRLLQAEAKAAGISTANLESFFDDWVYRDRGLPDFRIASTYVRTMLGGSDIRGANPASNSDINSAQAYLLTVTIENLGNAGAEVPVTASSRGIETEQKRLWVPARSKASIRIPLSSRPDRVTVNDGSVPESDMSNHSAAVTPAE